MKAGDTLPHLPVYPVPPIPPDGGISGFPRDQETVTISERQADLLVMELLNVYCFACQIPGAGLQSCLSVDPKEAGVEEADQDDWGGHWKQPAKRRMTSVRNMVCQFPVIPDSEGLSSNSWALTSPLHFPCISVGMPRESWVW